MSFGFLEDPITQYTAVLFLRNFSYFVALSFHGWPDKVRLTHLWNIPWNVVLISMSSLKTEKNIVRSRYINS